MRVFRRVIFAWLIVAASGWADPPPSYYAAATGLTGGPLKQALHGIVVGQTVVPYGSLIAPLTDIWRDPANPANILLTYSHTSVPASSSWNREHLWPRSRGNSDQAGPDDSDLFHVVPTDAAVNAERASLYFDESDPGDPGYRIPAHPLAPQTSRDSDSWQPPPQERGDIARALFYMDMRYDGQEPQTTDFELVSFPPTVSQMGRLNTLLLWNDEDPPDDAERARNDLIYTSYQHNRNPFIDHPEWVAAIWGTGTPNGGGSRPIARASTLAASAVESPLTTGTFAISLNQFAGVGGISVAFTMSGTASPAEYSLTGPGVTYDAATGTGTVLIPENFSSALITLSPVNDAIAESAETAVATIVAGPGYTFVPDASSTTTLTITDAPSLPAMWNFNNTPYPNPLAANSGVGAISFAHFTGTVTSFSGTSGNALALVSNAGNGSWLEINLSMAGYTSLVLNFSTRGTSNGYNSGLWSASPDGVAFTTLQGVNTATQGTNFIARQVSFAGVPGLTDAPNVTLRYTLAGATSTMGNNRIDDLTIAATPIVMGTALRTVSLAAPDASANELGPDVGTFALQLNGLAPPGGLEVAVSFAGGSATSPGLAGADYTLGGLASYDAATRTGRVFLPEGQTAAVLTVTPLADTLTEGAETVIATLQALPTYLVGSSSTAIVTIAEPVANDAFAGAILLTGTQISTTGSNVGTTRETDEPLHYGSATGGHSVWWKWTAPADGTIAVKTLGSNFDTLLAVYSGATLATLTQLAVNDDSSGTTSAVALRVSAGTSYSIAVDGYQQSVGSVTLSLAFAPLPSVTMSVVNALAQERGSVPAVVRFTLSNASALPVALGLSVGGTATPGVDYTTTSGSFPSLTLAAGLTTSDFYFTPFADTNAAEKTETIVLALLSGTSYLLPPGLQNPVTLSIADDSPYSAAWLDEHPGLTPAQAAPLGDADGDGLPGIFEFIFDRDPRFPDSAAALSTEPLPFINPTDGLEKIYAGIRFARRTDASTIALTLQVRAALDSGTWSPGGVFISATPIPGTPRESVLYRSTLPLNAPTAPVSSFYRLLATPP